jgi:hypothetical protein
MSLLSENTGDTVDCLYVPCKELTALDAMLLRFEELAFVEKNRISTTARSERIGGNPPQNINVGGGGGGV